MISRNIKDLSIALEALTRVPGSDYMREQIETLLREEIEAKHRENNPIQSFPPNYKPPPNTTGDDEIPF